MPTNYPARFSHATAIEIWHAEQARTDDVHARGTVYYSTVDATGHHSQRVPCRVVDGELVQPHPTDPARGPIAAPTDTLYSVSIPDADEVAFRHYRDSQESAAAPKVRHFVIYADASAKACEAAEDYLTEHEGEDISIRVRPWGRGQVEGLFEVIDGEEHTRERMHSDPDDAELSERIEVLMRESWDHTAALGLD